MNDVVGSPLLSAVTQPSLPAVFAQDSFIGSPLFFVIGAVVLVGLVVLLFVLRNKRDEDD